MKDSPGISRMLAMYGKGFRWPAFWGACILVYIGNFSYAQTGGDKTGSLTWYTDVYQAGTISRQTNKPIFALFTGSDWCSWCRKLQREVFQKPAFVEWAQKNVVLLELDFPRNKQLSAKLEEQNRSLLQFFNVTGFPTVWIFYLKKDAETQKYMVTGLGSLGYPSGAVPGKEEVKFLEDAQAILSRTKDN